MFVFAFFWRMQDSAPWQCQQKKTWGGSLEEMPKISSFWVSVFFLIDSSAFIMCCMCPPPSPPPAPLPQHPPPPTIQPVPPFNPTSFLFRCTYMILFELYILCTKHFCLCFFERMHGTAPWQCQQKKTWGGFLEEMMKISSFWISVFFLIDFYWFLLL